MNNHKWKGEKREKDQVIGNGKGKRKYNLGTYCFENIYQVLLPEEKHKEINK